MRGKGAVRLDLIVILSEWALSVPTGLGDGEKLSKCISHHTMGYTRVQGVERRLKSSEYRVRAPGHPPTASWARRHAPPSPGEHDSSLC